ncbi:DNA damage checkpoint control protein MEC3 [Spathaspora sp. JA1]|nr:DNA damage checkpoint control protein MEC3 [Spathaspora sp. JA1]
MKLKLKTKNTETLKTTLSLISQLRKYVILKFTPQQLSVISINGISPNQEPQVWCKFKTSSLFDEMEISSLNENTILLEINVDLLLQTLRNFDRANSDGLFIRLQRKDATGAQGTNISNGRTASLALFYSNVNINANVVNHTFKIPVKILKNNNSDMTRFQEPGHSNVGMIIRLPNEFVSMFKRLEKFRKGSSSNETVTIRASKKNQGFLGFVLEEEGKFKVTISWNGKLEIMSLPTEAATNDPDSLIEVINNAHHSQAQDNLRVRDSHNDDEVEITVKLKDWHQASKIVGTCHTVILLICERDCVLHCFLDDSDDADIVYYINGLRIRNHLD